VARKFAYYPGCVAEFSSKELNSTTKALAPLLDIDLQPMPAATCCGAGDVAEAKPNLYLTLNVRILSQAEEMGHDIMTICNVCTLNLRRANKLVKEDPRLLEAVNEELVKAGARPYEGTREVTHLLWYIATEEGLSLLERQGPKGLNGLRVAPYYGCQFSRPMGTFDDVQFPTTMDRLFETLGADVITEYDAKTDCCGGMMMLTKAEGALRLCHELLTAARQDDAQVIVAACPLCEMNLEAYQPKVNATFGTDFNIPVMYFTQLAGLALGVDPRKLAVDKQVTSCESLLAAIPA